MSAGKSVRLFLADGTPGGLVTAEIMNWTGHVVAAPRSDLAALMRRPESRRTGIYVLLGDDLDSLGEQMAYIGEGDDLSKRLYQHARPESQGGKDFWDRAIVLTSKDANLTKAHARYLESRLITLAKEAGRVKLDNSTAPSPIDLPEADTSDMEYFIEQTKIVLPVLGVNIFRSSKITSASPNSPAMTARTNSPVFEMMLKKLGITANAQEIDGEFTVLEDSGARLAWDGSAALKYTNLRTRLEHDGTLVASSDQKAMRFTRNHVFSSPSAAAAVISGVSTNGREAWKAKGTGKTYGQWETEGVEEAMNTEVGGN